MKPKAAAVLKSLTHYFEKHKAPSFDFSCIDERYANFSIEATVGMVMSKKMLIDVFALKSGRINRDNYAVNRNYEGLDLIVKSHRKNGTDVLENDSDGNTCTIYRENVREDGEHGFTEIRVSRGVVSE